MSFLHRNERNKSGTRTSGLYGYYFTNPYFDMASTFIPSNIKEIFKKCEYLYYNNPVVRPATDRVANYFITDLKFNGEENEGSEKIRHALIKDIKINARSRDVGIDGIVYGNSISTIFLPFTRMLYCKDHPTVKYNAEKVSYRFENFNFHAHCYKCDKIRIMEVDDVPLRDTSKINIHRWNPRQIDINYDFWSGKKEYYWNIPDNYKNQLSSEINSGRTGNTEPNRLRLNNIPIEVLKAIKNNEKFKIDSRFVFHYKHPALAGVEHQWGFPVYLNIIKLDYHIALLRKANEVIANDYIVPFRILSPAGNAGTDPIQNLSYSNFVGQMRQMVLDHRVDPADVKISPVPVQYQAFGGEAKALNTSELVKGVSEEQLHSLNYPAELFFNTLQIQAMPTALRLFENNWSYLVDGINEFLQWVCNHVCDHMKWDKREVSYTRVTTADDIERRQVMMNLAASNQISLITALKQYGIDLKEELKNIANQTKMQQEIEQELMEDQAMQQQMSEEQQMNPLDMNSQADQIAMNMLQIPDESMREQHLRELKKSNETIHALVTTKMREMRSHRGTDAFQQGQQAGVMPMI